MRCACWDANLELRLLWAGLEGISGTLNILNNNLVCLNCVTGSLEVNDDLLYAKVKNLI